MQGTSQKKYLSRAKSLKKYLTRATSQKKHFTRATSLKKAREPPLQPLLTITLSVLRQQYSLWEFSQHPQQIFTQQSSGMLACFASLINVQLNLVINIYFNNMHPTLPLGCFPHFHMSWITTVDLLPGCACRCNLIGQSFIRWRIFWRDFAVLLHGAPPAAETQLIPKPLLVSLRPTRLFTYIFSYFSFCTNIAIFLVGVVVLFLNHRGIVIPGKYWSRGTNQTTN